METVCSGLKIQNAIKLCNSVLLSYGRAQLVSNLWNDKSTGAGSGISMKLEALEPDLFKQCVQMMWK